MRAVAAMAFCALVGSGLAAAQSMNKCTGPDGRVTFSDAPYPEGTKGSAAAAAPESLETKARRWGISARAVRDLVRECEKDGNITSCQVLDAIRNPPEKLSAAAIAKRSGIWTESDIRRMQADCAQGQDFDCKAPLLWQAKEPTEESVKKKLADLCASGAEGACEQIISTRDARDPRVVAMARRKCDQGHANSCRMLSEHKLLDKKDARLELKEKCASTWMDACASLRGEVLR